MEQISGLLPVWDGVHCAATHEQITELVAKKRAEVLEQIRELQQFAAQLGEISDSLRATPPPSACLPDLSCCVSTASGTGVTELIGMPVKRAAVVDTSPLTD